MDISPAILHEEETEEALSLNNSPTTQFPSQSAPVFASDEFFEFSSGSNNDMSHAEDIIFCGKLISLNQKSHDQANEQTQDDCNRIIVTREEEEREKSINGNSNSNSSNRKQLQTEIKYTTQPNSPKSKYMRSSKSLDYQQLRRSLSSDCRSAGIRRYSSARTSGIYDNSGEKVYNKPRWYSMLFGLASKVPREMDLRDMKNRLVRRTPSTMFPQSDSGPILAAKRNSNKSSWGLLGVLSCKDNGSISVVSSLGCLTHVHECENRYSRATCT